MTLGGPKQRSLLALLLLAPNEVVSRDRLIEELWPGEPPADAAHTVQVFVSRLRKALGPDVVETRSPGYLVRVADGGLDVARFERLHGSGSRALEEGRAGRAEQALAEALALFRGPPLADFAYESWAQREVARLEEARLACLGQWVEAGLALGRHGELAPELERLAAEHPLRERFRLQLMLALYRQGRQADALACYQQLRERLDDELGIEPSAEARELQRRILNQDPALDLAPATRTARVELPQPATPFLGRRREVAEVVELLTREDVRLLTLTGPGGAGKTRLAVQAAGLAAGDYGDGAVWVPLASVRDASLVLPAIAAGLNAGGDLAGALSDRDLLLVLDNAEQVLDAAVDLAGLLAAAPGLTLLVTSREPLAVYGEHEYRVPMLATEDAVELFLARARAVHGEDGSTATVAAICDRLDRLPLAIELAAAHTRSFSPELIHARLEQRLPLLVGGPRDVPERQRTLRAAIDWSYDLLTEAERGAFVRLGVFAGGAPLEAAEAVCGAGFDLVSALAAKNLLRAHSDRVWMLETIREYAAGRLDESADAERTRRGHARWCRAALEVVGTSEESLERAWLEQHNARAAVAWARTAGEPVLALELAVKLAELLSVRGSLAEARGLLDATLDEAPGAPAELRALALHEAAAIAIKQGDGAAIRSLSEAARGLADEMNDAEGAVRALAKLAVVALQEGDLVAAAGYSKEATELALEADDVRTTLNALNVLGTVELARKNYALARATFEQALELASPHVAARRETVATLHYNVAVAAYFDGDAPAAEQALRRTLSLYRSLAHLEGIAYCFVVRAAQRGSDDPAEAAALLAAAQRLLDEVGAALEPVERSLADSTWARASADLDDEALAAARRAGGARAEAEIERAGDRR